MNIQFASHNKHKYQEMLAILKTQDIHLKNDFYIDENSIIEDGATFKENAVIKALIYAKASNQVALADDSGLIVETIKPLPGIYSKRYSGLGDDENNIKLLDVLKNHKNRYAKFVCVIAIAFPDGKIFTYEGIMEGKIALGLKGDEGFGYDPIFIPKGKRKTLAELGQLYKDQHSHRACALKSFLEAKNEVIDYWRHSWQK